MIQEAKEKKFVLIDDDPTYCTIMTRIAEQCGASLDVYPSLMDMGSVGLLGRYDLAIVDYDLGQINGVEIAEYLSALFGSIPMILISATQRDEGSERWPANIKQFCLKSNGYQHVIEQAQRLVNPSAQMVANAH